MNWILLEFEDNQEPGFLDKVKEKALGSVKTKIVSILSGNMVLEKIGTIIDLISFLPGIDGDAIKNKLKDFTKSLHGGLEDVNIMLEKIPLLQELFGDEKDFLKNVARMGLFAQQISLGTYPQDKYELKNVLLVQSTLIAIIALTVVTAGAWITATFGVGLWASCAAYNKVFECIEGDVKEFEKWLKENDKNPQELQKNILKGKANMNESLFSGALKLGAKMLGKGATKTTGKMATKSAGKSLLGKAASRLGPKMSKGLGKLASSTLKAIEKLSPKTAEILRKQGPTVVEYCVSNGLSSEEILAYIGDFITDSFEKASSEDKKVIDIMKDDLKKAANPDEILAKLSNMIDATME